jgi:ATP-dependent Clp protease protease subunit
MLMHGSTQNFSEESGQGPLKLRSIAITGPITEQTSVEVVRALLTMEAEDLKMPIVIFINTPGGSVYEAFAIYDVMKAIKPPIVTVGIGKIMSAGVLLVSAGNKGHRYATPNSYFMTHDMQCHSSGTFQDTDAQHKHLIDMRDRYLDIMAVETKMTLAVLKKKLLAEDYFTAKQAKKLGIIDFVSLKKPTAFFRDLE